MNLLRFVSAAFINTFGITQPRPDAERRASLWIVLLLTAVLAVVAGVAVILRSAFRA